MDASSFRPGDWLLVIGGAVMLVLAQVLDWATVDSERGSGGLNNAFDYPATGGIAWALTVAAGLLAFLFAGGFIARRGADWDLILLAATAAATVLMVIRVVLGGGEISRPGITYELGRGPGMWTALVAAALALGGALLNWRAAARPTAAVQPSVRQPQSG